MDQAIDPITGEINWNCPCMGNNPKGPCGPLFKLAFSCFIKNQNNPEVCSTFINNMNDCQKKHSSFYAQDTDSNQNNNIK